MKKTNKVLWLSGLLLVLIFAGSSLASSTSFALIEGQSTIINLEGINRVAVGDESIADVLVLSSGELLVNGNQVGITSLHVWSETKQLQYQLRVYADDGTLIKELLTHIALPEVNAWFIGHHLVLDGEVASSPEKERALQIAQAYSSSVIDLLQYPKIEAEIEQVDQAEGPSVIEQLTGILGSDIAINMYGDTLFLEGVVTNDFVKERAVAISEAFHQPVVDLLQIAETPQSELVISAKETDISEISIEHDNHIDRAEDSNTGKSQGPAEAVQETEYVEVDEPEFTLAEAIELLAPQIGPEITIRDIYGHLVLEGKVNEDFSKKRAHKLASIFPFTIIDLVQVIPEEKGEAPVVVSSEPVEITDIAEAIDEGDISLSWAGQALLVEGWVTDSFTKERALAIAQAMTPTVLDFVRVKPKSESKPESPPPPVVEEEPVEVEVDVYDFQSELITDLDKALQEPEVEVVFYGETLVLEGVVASAERKDRAERIAAMFYQPHTSFLELPAEPDIVEVITERLAIDTVEVAMVNSRLILQGTVADQAEHSRVLSIAEVYGNVVDLLHVEQEAQVLLEVQVLEVTKNAADDLGITWGSSIQGVFTPGQIDLSEITDWQFTRTSPLQVKIDALVNEGHAKQLAAPSLLTLSGKEASFLVGGEIPLPTPSEEGTDFIFRPFGVNLRIAPRVQKDHVTVQVNPEVSSLDWSNAIDVEGTRIPAFKTKKASTTLRVAEGSTVVLGGLISYEEVTQVKKIPFLGDIPVFGALFRSTQYLEQQTELVILITPWILYQEGVDFDEQQ